LTKRRAKGEGSIVARSDGLYQFSIDLGRDGTGRRQRRYLYARSRPALLKKIEDEKARGGGSLQPRATGTVGEWVEQWLRESVQPDLSRNTFDLYQRIWKVHAAPFLQNVQLEKLDVGHVERLYAALRKKGVGTSILQRVGVVLSRAIAVAIRRGRYRKANPFRIVEKPKHRHKEVRVLTAAEARRFIKSARGTRFEALWLLLLSGGLRISEALGLEWRDVDFEHHKLAVRQGVTEVNGKAQVGPLKTTSSRRQVELGALAIEALRRRKAAARKESNASRFVFSTETGGHPSRSGLRQRYFQPILTAAKIEGITIHGLRHSMTTLALAEGVPVKAVDARLGHSTSRLTMDRYGHLIGGADHAAAHALDAVLNPKMKRSRRH
jgi:integrase